MVERLVWPSRTVVVKGFRWQGDLEAASEIGIDGFSAKVLCERHNSALSKLDQVGGRFVGALTRALERRIEGVATDFHRLFNGANVQRWMLKVLCGLNAAGRVSRDRHRTPWHLPLRWLDVLLGDAAFSRGTGLYLRRGQIGSLNASPVMATESICATPLWAGKSGVLSVEAAQRALVVGIGIGILGVALDLYMVPQWDRQAYAYRPRMLKVPDIGSAGAAYFHFGWEEHAPTFQGKLLAN